MNAFSHMLLCCLIHINTADRFASSCWKSIKEMYILSPLIDATINITNKRSGGSEMELKVSLNFSFFPDRRRTSSARAKMHFSSSLSALASPPPTLDNWLTLPYQTIQISNEFSTSCNKLALKTRCSTFSLAFFCVSSSLLPPHRDWRGGRQAAQPRSAENITPRGRFSILSSSSEIEKTDKVEFRWKPMISQMLSTHDECLWFRENSTTLFMTAECGSWLKSQRAKSRLRWAGRSRRKRKLNPEIYLSIAINFLCMFTLQGFQSLTLGWTGRSESWINRKVLCQCEQPGNFSSFADDLKITTIDISSQATPTPPNNIITSSFS